MLQALKNLEARSAQAAGEGWLAHLAQKGPVAPAASATLVMPAPAEVVTHEVDADEPLPARARPQRRDRAQLEPARPSGPAAKSATEIAPARLDSSPSASSRKPSSLERQVLRTLTDKARSAPLAELADRLQRDSEHTASKTLLLVGIGETSTGHEAALYAAALLAERHGHHVLLIDADFGRRSLSKGLDAGQIQGTTEAVAGSSNVRELILPIALPGVSLLPAGTVQSGDLLAGEHLESIWQTAGADYTLVLIDGGRSDDPAATALARASDATYFVVQLGAVETREAQAALHSFRAASVQVAGCIAT